MSDGKIVLFGGASDKHIFGNAELKQLCRRVADQFGDDAVRKVWWRAFEWFSNQPMTVDENGLERAPIAEFHARLKAELQRLFVN
jgi:hypothetical protein